MDINNIATWVAVIVALFGVYLNYRKQGKEEQNIDAETMSSLSESLNASIKRTKDIQKAFDAYKKTMTKQLQSMALDNADLKREFESYKRNTTKELREKDYEIGKLKDKIRVLEAAGKISE